MNRIRIAAASLAVLAIGGCAYAPTGPSVMALPGTGKSFDQFRTDDMVCREYALQQSGGTTAQDAANNNAVGSAAVGTVVGAAAGALINGGRGAGVGAGTGLLFGAAAGSGSSQHAAYGQQRRYDQAYVQCMYAKGERVPVNGRHIEAQPRYDAPASRSYPVPPPPPPGMPPPPPPAN